MLHYMTISALSAEAMYVFV